MKEHIQRHKKKYTVAAFIVIAALIIFLILSGVSIFSGINKPTGKVSASLADKTIKTGESTQLSLGAKNTGKIPLIGTFQATVDDPTSVTISYPSPELLKFELLPGESIERVMNVTGTSKAYKTHYKITISILNENSTYAKDTAILIVNGK